jgi:hypothetical protein
MPPYVLWHSVDIVRPEATDEYVASVFRVERAHELETTFAVTSKYMCIHVYVIIVLRVICTDGNRHFVEWCLLGCYAVWLL